MFCHITRNWRGKPPTSHEAIINLIGSTKTNIGLTSGAGIDSKKYEKGIKVTDSEMDSLSIEYADFHGEWNYIISPQN